jgi:membrane-bound metal-dependent hydrolase YbcI (DUF457 family)
MGRDRLTSYEHAMLGATAALATGLHRKWGWPIVALASVAAVLPDWDGLSILFGAAAFDRVHRCAGHNLPVCLTLGVTFAAADYRWRLIWRVKELAARRFAMFATAGAPSNAGEPGRGGLCAWITVGLIASLSHLAADLVFSGHATLSDWGLQLLWPFSNRVWVYPMVAWGDPVPAVIFGVGMLAMLWRPARLRMVAVATLAALFGYIALRGVVGI